MAYYQVEFYENIKGDAPVEDFINSLDNKMGVKIYGLLVMLSNNGPALREPYSKHLDDGIFELRAKVGSDITRVLYFFYYHKRAIVTNGFVKKTQKTPQAEINKAKSLRSDWLKREEQGL